MKTKIQDYREKYNNALKEYEEANREYLRLKVENNKEITKLVVIRNCVSLMCCTILAIAFNKWWLIFIAILFTSFVENVDEVDEGDKKCIKN